MAIRIVITGAPASGKTECVERLKRLPSLSNFLFFDELARQLLTESPEFRHHWLEFHVEIYRRQIARETEAVGRSFISDRGTMDAFAFHPEAMGVIDTNADREYVRYDRVFHLGSAANLGESYYHTDTIRTETREQALGIERAIASVWGGHPGYEYFAAKPDFETKFRDLAARVEQYRPRPSFDDPSMTASL